MKSISTHTFGFYKIAIVKCAVVLNTDNSDNDFILIKE